MLSKVQLCVFFGTRPQRLGRVERSLIGRCLHLSWKGRVTRPRRVETFQKGRKDIRDPPIRVKEKRLGLGHGSVSRPGWFRPIWLGCSEFLLVSIWFFLWVPPGYWVLLLLALTLCRGNGRCRTTGCCCHCQPRSNLIEAKSNGYHPKFVSLSEDYLFFF